MKIILVLLFFVLNMLLMYFVAPSIEQPFVIFFFGEIVGICMVVITLLLDKD